MMSTKGTALRTSKKFDLTPKNLKTMVNNNPRTDQHSQHSKDEDSPKLKTHINSLGATKDLLMSNNGGGVSGH